MTDLKFMRKREQECVCVCVCLFVGEISFLGTRRYIRYERSRRVWRECLSNRNLVFVHDFLLEVPYVRRGRSIIFRLRY